MLPDRRVPTHPGAILATEFLKPLGMTQVQLAKKLGIPVQRVNELVRGKRGVTAETAWLLGGEFRTGPEFWMNLQSAHDLVRVRLARAGATAAAGWQVLNEGDGIHGTSLAAEPAPATYAVTPRAGRSAQAKRATKRSRARG
jgi:addiction module HigA family antidote